MKTNVLGFITLIFVGCNSDNTQEKTNRLAAVDSTKTVASVVTYPAAPPTISGGLKAIKAADIPKHIPKGFIMKAFVQGNLNGDDIEDVLLVVENPANTALPRSVLVLEGQKDATLKVADVGAKAALCHDCGGMMGDPFQDAVILKDNTFQLNFFGGSREKWVRSVDFQYDTNSKKWLLVRNEHHAYDNGNADKPIHTLKTAADKGFVKMPLATFDVAEGQ
ncbi:MAG: hypothetical protein RIS64_550 [Bacteroidota bacterium]|jgi:hypothetical protein